MLVNEKGRISIFKTWGLFGSPRTIKIDSCTKPQHLRWSSPSPDICSPRRRERPKPTIGPEKLTTGDITGNGTSPDRDRRAILLPVSELLSSTRRAHVDRRLVAKVGHYKRGNAILQGAFNRPPTSTWLDLPYKCVGVNTALHKEVHLLPLDGCNDRLVVEGDIKAEGGLTKAIAAAFLGTQEGSILWGVHHQEQNNSYSRLYAGEEPQLEKQARLSVGHS